MKVTLWINYGGEGWHPTEYDSPEAASEAILKGAFSSYEHRITRDLTLSIYDASNTEERK